MTRDQERFWDKVTFSPDSFFSPECWPWTGARDLNGYGRFRMNRKTFLAHRLAWLFTRDDGAVLDHRDILHRCDNPSCCNPFHLWVGTAADNVADMFSKGRQKAYPQKTHCSHGHEYTTQNTYWWGKDGHLTRHCRACHRHRAMAHYRKHRETNR